MKRAHLVIYGAEVIITYIRFNFVGDKDKSDSLIDDFLNDDWLSRRCNASAEYGLFGSSIAFSHFLCSRSAIDPAFH